MSTTFKDGLREAMAKEAERTGFPALARAIRDSTPPCCSYEELAAAALAYCDQWEERRVVDDGEAMYPADSCYLGTARTILIRREPPKPTVDIEKAKREIKKLREDVILRKLCVEARIREALEALGEKEDR